MEESFEVVVNRLSPTLKRITHRLNGHFSFFDDDDLFQEALVHLWGAFRHGSLTDKTDSYILQGCYFHLKNYIRKTMDKARLVSLYRLMDEADASLEDVLPLADASASREAEERILTEQARMSGLTAREKEVLSFCLDGLTTREIGSRLGISHVMVIKIRDRIKDKCAALRKILEGGLPKLTKFYL